MSSAPMTAIQLFWAPLKKARVIQAAANPQVPKPSSAQASHGVANRVSAGLGRQALLRAEAGRITDGDSCGRCTGVAGERDSIAGEAVALY